MNAFIAGFIFGIALAGAAAVLLFTRKPRAHVPDPWTEEYHQQPQVTTTVLVNKRKVQL